ncbi:hypothetical protein V2I01_15160 [Micromonospora sp. BRA006-A]|nr:hypothetical protein [Micromonospora sp. BRA006-A]
MNLLRAELRRVLATRMCTGLLLTAVALGGGLVGLMALVGPENFDPPMPGLHTEEGLRSILGILGFTAFVPAAAGPSRRRPSTGTAPPPSRSCSRRAEGGCSPPDLPPTRSSASATASPWPAPPRWPCSQSPPRWRVAGPARPHSAGAARPHRRRDGGVPARRHRRGCAAPQPGRCRVRRGRLPVPGRARPDDDPRRQRALPAPARRSHRRAHRLHVRRRRDVRAARKRRRRAPATGGRRLAADRVRARRRRARRGRPDAPRHHLVSPFRRRPAYQGWRRPKTIRTLVIRRPGSTMGEGRRCMDPVLAGLPTDRVVALPGADADAVAMAIAHGHAELAAVVHRPVSACTMPADFVHAVLDRLERVAVELLPAWLPEAAHDVRPDTSDSPPYGPRPPRARAVTATPVRSCPTWLSSR